MFTLLITTIIRIRVVCLHTLLLLLLSFDKILSFHLATSVGSAFHIFHRRNARKKTVRLPSGRADYRAKCTLSALCAFCSSVVIIFIVVCAVSDNCWNLFALGTRATRICLRHCVWALCKAMSSDFISISIFFADDEMKETWESNIWFYNCINRTWNR